MDFDNLNEAILQALQDLNMPSTYIDVYNKIVENEYYTINGQNPATTVCGHLGGFIRRGDVRVARVLAHDRPNKPYVYYLTANQDNIDQQDNREYADDTDEIAGGDMDTPTQPETNEQGTLLEKSLHRPLITFLASPRMNIHAVTIPHENSTKSDKAQTWTHPDIVGVQLINLTNNESKTLQRVINTSSAFKISSIEVKIRINSDKDLKEGFFQAVSNSSWANYGYLAALEFRDDRHIREEMERLNESFGIGFIEISATAFESKILYPSRYRDLDFRTIDKLCGNNERFKSFIEKINSVLNNQQNLAVADLIYNGLIADFQTEEIDRPMITDSEIRDWIRDKYIPWEETPDST